MSSSTTVCGLNPTEDDVLSACKVGAPVSDSLNAYVSWCSVFIRSQTNFSLHSTFFFKRLKRTFYYPVALLNESRNHAVHLASPVIFIHNRLVLINDKCNALEKSR